MDWYGQHGGIVNNDDAALDAHTGVYSNHFNLAKRTGPYILGGLHAGFTQDTYCGVTFDAHAANSIYGSSTTVTPESLKTGFYIKF